MANNYIKEGNITTSVIKNKDIERVIKGEIEFQITNIKGEVIEGKSENLLSNNFIFNMMARQLLPNFNNPNEVNDIDSQGLCNKINLINTTQEEDASLGYIKGNTVGFIDFSNTQESSNTLEGLATSNTKYKQDLVFMQGEWDLRKSNGELNTVALYGDGGFNSIGGVGFNFKKIVNFNKELGATIPAGRIAYYSKNRFFVLEGNTHRITSYYLESKDGYLITKKDLDLGSVIEYADNFFYLRSIDRFIITKDMKAFYYKIEDNRFVLEKEKDIPKKIIATGLNDKIYATEAYTTAEETNNIYILDTEFNFISGTSINLINDIFAMSLNLDEDQLIINTSSLYNNTNLIYILDLTTNTIISCSNNTQGIISFYPINFNFKNSFIVDNSIYTIPSFHSTQNKLPKSVTKTELTGMKINYSFRFRDK